MKKYLWFLLLFLSTLVAAQTTPNYGFQVPPFNSPNWNVAMNQNWYSLDNILLGITATGGSLQCKPLSSLSPPPAGEASVVCCLDCQLTNPCTGGGSGAIATGLNGVLNCAASGGGGLNDPGASGIVFRTNTVNGTRVSTFNDFSALISGVPNGTKFLRDDGSWQTSPASGVSSSSSSPGPIAGYVGAPPSTTVQADPNCNTDFHGDLVCATLQGGTVVSTSSGASGPLYPNAAGGTTSGLLAKIVAGQIVTATTSDTALPVFVVMPTLVINSVTICAGGTSGNGCIATSGLVACTADAGGGTAGHFVVASTTTAGRCHDAGAAIPTGPVAIVGQWATSPAANASGTVAVEPAFYPAGSGTGVADPGANCIMVRTSFNVSAPVTITGGTGITVTNGCGTGGNPTVAVDATVWTATSTVGATTNKSIDAEGTGNVLTRPFYVEFTPGCGPSLSSNPGAFNSPSSGATTFTCFGTTTTLAAADFVDGSTTGVGGYFTLPQGWTGNLDVRIYWFGSSATTNAPFFSIQTGCVSDSQAVSTGPSYNTASTGASSYTGTANQRKTLTLLGLSMTNCSAGETMFFILQRLGANGSDTYAATAEVFSVQFRGRATQ